MTTTDQAAERLTRPDTPSDRMDVRRPCTGEPMTKLSTT